MVLNNTPKRSTRSQGHFTRQQRPPFSLSSVVSNDPKYIAPNNRHTEAWVREQEGSFPASIIKLTEQGLNSEAHVHESRVQRIIEIEEEVTGNLAAFQDPRKRIQQILFINNHGREQQASPAAKPHGKSSQVLEVKRPKLATNVPVEVVQQPTPLSPTGWSTMKDFLMTELRREMGLPSNPPQYNDNVDEKSVNLACPLFIRNPAAFTHVRNSCTDGNIKGGIGKLIEHIKRVHLRSDKQCHNCGTRLGSKPAESKSSHSRSCTKTWSPHEPPLLTEEQQRVLDNLSVRASGQSLDYKYRHKLLMKLYPGQEEWAKKVDIYHDPYSPCLLPAQLMFDAMEKAVDRWERGYATPQYDSDGSDADSDQSRDYRRFSGSSPSASSTDASSAYPSASSGGYSRGLGGGGGRGGEYGTHQAYQQSGYQDQSWDINNMAMTNESTQLEYMSTSVARRSSHEARKHRGQSRPADADYGAMQLEQDYNTYAHSGTMEDMDELNDSSYIDPFEPAFDVASDFHSYTMDVEQGFASDYHIQGQYPKDTINPKDIHNTLIGMGSEALPRYLLENEEDAGIVLPNTQEYLGFAGQARKTRR
ncbi:hypothetical protein CCHL11_04470 [Colletotrichum chlorophyti]|uniref:Uncharacterized protein n=1 Tax=Colletotrichum chlorophyti TaxID=708187 RepID=A0A1Q8S428_9PEZI|nr:hypothetical protein CCHL11_04470 [Colletotrichum chlorophyti]